MKSSFKLALLSMAGIASLAYVNMASAQEVTGAGASFPAPLYSNGLLITTRLLASKLTTNR
jgi:phosphate transport system substrate-binding protein